MDYYNYDLFGLLIVTISYLMQREVQMQNQIRGDKNNLLKALWEKKTDNIVIKNVAKNRIADIKKR